MINQSIDRESDSAYQASKGEPAVRIPAVQYAEAEILLRKTA